MNRILLNMALILLSEFCTEQGINIAGSRVVKVGRGFTFSLVDYETGTREFAAITFHKSQIPSYRRGRDYVN